MLLKGIVDTYDTNLSHAWAVKTRLTSGNIIQLDDAFARSIEHTWPTRHTRQNIPIEMRGILFSLEFMLYFPANFEASYTPNNITNYVIYKLYCVKQVKSCITHRCAYSNMHHWETGSSRTELFIFGEEFVICLLTFRSFMFSGRNSLTFYRA